MTSNKKTWCLQVDVSIENADILIPILSQQLATDLVNAIESANGVLIPGELTIEIQDAFHIDEDGDIYPLKRLVAKANYVEKVAL